MRRIPTGDFQIGPAEKKAVMAVLDSNRISEGKVTRELEREWAKYIGTKYAIAVNSGTSALLAGLLALIYDNRFPKIKPGAKVITSPLTYAATSNAIKLLNLEPVFVDVNPLDFTLDLEQVKNILEKENPDDFGIILPVHLFGYPNDMDEINKIAKKFKLVSFEDSAQAHGTIYKGKKTGSLSLLSDFSFYIAHNIQAGEMGMVNTDDEKIAKLVKKIKANGRLCDCPQCLRSKGTCNKMDLISEEDPEHDFDPRFMHDLIGFNFKIMDLQAALALTQVKKADEIFKQRSKNVKYLNQHLAQYQDLLQLPVYSPEVSYLAYPMVIKQPKKLSRRHLRAELERRGIENRPLFGCIPTQQPAYKAYKQQYKGKLPHADYAGKYGLYIGCHQYLTKEDLDYVATSIGEVLNGIKK